MQSNFLFCLRIGRCNSNFWLNSIELPKSQRQLSHFSEPEAFEVWKKRKYFSRDGSTIAWEGILMRLERDWILMISEIGKICPQPYSAPLFSFTINNILTKTKNQGIYFIHVIFLIFKPFSILWNLILSSCNRANEPITPFASAGGNEVLQNMWVGHATILNINFVLLLQCATMLRAPLPHFKSPWSFMKVVQNASRV